MTTVACIQLEDRKVIDPITGWKIRVASTARAEQRFQAEVDNLSMPQLWQTYRELASKPKTILNRGKLRYVRDNIRLLQLCGVR